MTTTFLSRPKLLIPVSVLISSLVLSACGGGAPNAASLKKHLRNQNRELGIKYAIAATPQTTQGFSVVVRSLSVTESSTPGTGGYVAIASDVAGAPGDVLGYKKINDGTLRNVTITVVDKLTTGNYYFMLFPAGRAPAEVRAAKARILVRVTVK